MLALVPTHRPGPLLGHCLASLAAADCPALVIANGADPARLRQLKAAFPTAHFVEHRRALGFAPAVNLGLSRALAFQPDWILLLNDDAALLPGALEALLEVAESGPSDRPSDHGVGVLGPRLLLPDGRTDSLGLALSRLGMGRELEHGATPPETVPEPREVLAVSGACLLVRAQLLAQLGGLDPGYGSYLEDVDLCLAAWDRGLRVLAVPQAEARHHKSVTFGQDTPAQRRALARNAVRLLLKTYPASRLPLLAPLAGLRLGARVVAAAARRRPELAWANARAAADLLTELPYLAAQRRPMRPETYARVLPAWSHHGWRQLLR